MIETEPGRTVKEVWAYLSDSEARELLAALSEYFSEPQAPGWHCHISDSDGNELSIALGEPDDSSFASRLIDHS